MTKTLCTLKFLFAVAVLTLTACGGGGGNPTITPQSTTISGVVQTPSGAIARLESNNSVLLSVVDFLVPPAWAAVTGLTPVANVSVELIRIDDNGNQVGNVLATTQTDSTGVYILELPQGIVPSGDLVVQIRNSSNQPALRAMVAGETVDIDPVSQFILDTLVNEPGVVLSNLNIGRVQVLVNQVAAIDLDLSSVSTLDGAAVALETSTEVSQVVEPQVEVVVNSSLIVGAWTEQGSHPLMLVLYTNGRYIHWQDCTDTQDGAGVEHGTYVYDGTTFSATPSVDQNGGCGLSEWQSFPVTVDNNQLSFGSGLDSGTLSRVWNNNSNSIVGGWDIRSTLAQPGAIVFDAAGNYIQYQPVSADELACPQGGVEYGTYIYDGASITGTVTVDENNDCGLGDGAGTAVNFPNVTVANNEITFNDGEVFSFDRVEFSPGDFPDGTDNVEPVVIAQDLPVATITVDGDASDWASVAAVDSDPQGDQVGNSSTDLRSLKVAIDNSQFYLLMETDGPIALPHTPEQNFSHYEVGLHFFTDAECSFEQELGFFIANNFTDSGGQNFHSLDSYISGYNGSSTQFAFQGPNLETSFNLSDLPTEATHIAFNPYIQSFGINSNTQHDNLGGGVFGCYALP